MLKTMTEFIELGFSCSRGWPTNSMIRVCCQEAKGQQLYPSGRDSASHTQSTVQCSHMGNSWVCGQPRTFKLTSPSAVREKNPNQRRSWRSKAAKSCRFCLLVCPSLCTCLSAQTLAQQGCPSPWDAGVSRCAANALNWGCSSVVISFRAQYCTEDPPWGFSWYLLLGRMG